MGVDQGSQKLITNKIEEASSISKDERVMVIEKDQLSMGKNMEKKRSEVILSVKYRLILENPASKD